MDSALHISNPISYIGDAPWALETLVLDEVIECLCQHPFWLWAAHEEKAKVKHMKQVDEWAST